MNLRTFRGNSMAQALAEVKKDLGQNAVILHTRTYRVGAVFGLGGRNIVEITASDQAAAREARKAASRTAPPNPYGTRVPLATAPSGERVASAKGAARAAGAVFVPSTFDVVRARESAGDRVELSTRIEVKPSAEVRPAVAASDERFRPSGEAPIARLVGATATLAPVDDAALSTLQEELASIKKLVGQVLHCSRRTAATLTTAEATSTGTTPSPAAGVLNLGGMSDPLFALYLKLTEGGVSSDLAELIAGKVRDELSPGELSDSNVVEQSMLRHLADIMRVVGGMPRAGLQPDSRPLTIALVGPTGVGKTTTIAKLAALYKLRHNKRVGLITADTYRIAAVDQLRTYANIIGLPLKVVNNANEMAGALNALSESDLILVDTAGRSQHDKSRLGELAGMVGAVNPHETHLVLSTAASDAVIRRTCDRFSPLSPSRLVLTKLDEAVTLGSVVNISQTTRLPISFLTTGQEVPDQIELADADRLARTVLLGRAESAGEVAS